PCLASRLNGDGQQRTCETRDQGEQKGSPERYLREIRHVASNRDGDSSLGRNEVDREVDWLRWPVLRALSPLRLRHPPLSVPRMRSVGGRGAVVPLERLPHEPLAFDLRSLERGAHRERGARPLLRVDGQDPPPIRHLRL